ncbi:MAG: polyprenyl synthetase family protein [Silanimonas sp.]
MLRREHVEPALRAYVDELPAGRLKPVVAEGLLAPGKRFRALLVWATGIAIGATPRLLADAALAVELVHAHSLVLDDLPCMDDAPTRRGRPALHRRHGEALALLAASAMLSDAYAILARGGDGEAGRRALHLARACGLGGIAEGQAEDLADPRRSCLGKTVPLIIAAVQLGAACGGSADARARAVMERFAMEVGAAYQERDDLLDEDRGVSADPSQRIEAAIRELRLSGLDAPLLEALARMAVSRTD